MKTAQVAVSSLGLPGAWVAGLGEQVVVSRVGGVLRIESTQVAAARAKLKRLAARLQANAAPLGLSERVLAQEVKAVRNARAARAAHHALPD
jgi:hypothetical protein